MLVFLTKRLKAAEGHLHMLNDVYKKKKAQSASEEIMHKFANDIRMQKLVIQAIQVQIKEINDDLEALEIYEIEADWIEV